MSRFDRLWSQVQDIGRTTAAPGFYRLTGTRTDFELREWFVAAAQERGLTTDTDRIGNLWAWSGDPDAAVRSGKRCLVLGSHLDSVPGGGAFDGLLGVVSAFAALDRLRASGEHLASPVGVVAFVEEEGSRWGLTCLGSRALTGALDGDRVLALRDADGISFAEVLANMGARPEHFGPDRDVLQRIGVYVELHIEQGKGLVHLDRPVGVGSAIRPYGRWILTMNGEGNHAGTTRMEDRRDPMLALAQTIARTRESATSRGCVATIAKVAVHPNAANAIPSQVVAWLDARGPDAEQVRGVAADVRAVPGLLAHEESFTEREVFDPDVATFLARLLGDAPILESGAGHDAGSLAAAGVSTAMLFVRNPSGISHSPLEHAELADCRAGAAALETAILALDGRALDVGVSRD